MQQPGVLLREKIEVRNVNRSEKFFGIFQKMNLKIPGVGGLVH